jgi:hypothetical protein
MWMCRDDVQHACHVEVTMVLDVLGFGLIHFGLDLLDFTMTSGTGTAHAHSFY